MVADVSAPGGDCMPELPAQKATSWTGARVEKAGWKHDVYSDRVRLLHTRYEWRMCSLTFDIGFA